MTLLETYLYLCKKFHKYNLPKLKFKELNEWYIHLYNSEYNIDEDDINKASFMIFFISFALLVFSSFLFILINLLIIIFYSMIISLLISYKFNTYLYKKIYRDESILNALLYLIIINFSLIIKSLNRNSECCINFIELIKNYNLPISEKFKVLLKKIHEGANPERELLDIITPSQDFNYYVRDLVNNNFMVNDEYQHLDDTASERNFKVVLRDIETKISIVFFIGLFFPIGLCFLILFQQINIIIIILFIPFFFILLNSLFRKLVRTNIILMGLLEEYSIPERKRFDEFVIFLKSFAINLKNNISPEIAFVNAYLQNKNYFKSLTIVLEPQISRLLNFSCSFGEILSFLKEKLASIRYTIILDTIEKMLAESSYFTSEKILEILEIIFKHRRLEKKFNIILRGEKFKVLIFIILLPIIIGAIGGMLPLFIMITKNLEETKSLSYHNYFELINFFDFIIIFLTLFFSNLITCHYFLKVINFEQKYLIITISSVIFVLSFFISFMNALTFF